MGRWHAAAVHSKAIKYDEKTSCITYCLLDPLMSN